LLARHSRCETPLSPTTHNNSLATTTHTTTNMGKVGRFACILTPMLLTLASLICIVIVMIGQMSMKDNNPPTTALGRELYFFKVRSYLSHLKRKTNNPHRQTQANSKKTPKTSKTTSPITSRSTTTSSTRSKVPPRPKTSRTSTKSVSGHTARAIKMTKPASRQLPGAPNPNPTSGSTPSPCGSSRTRLRRRLQATTCKRDSTRTRKLRDGWCGVLELRCC
jgi:hypothetical protein